MELAFIRAILKLLSKKYSTELKSSEKVIIVPKDGYILVNIVTPENA